MHTTTFIFVSGNRLSFSSRKSVFYKRVGVSSENSDLEKGLKKPTHASTHAPEDRFSVRATHRQVNKV